MIGVVDNDMGNLRSVANAVTQSGFEVRIAAAVEPFDGFTHLILPGVGSFQRAMDNLNESGIAEAIRSFAASGRPVLGICLGMQLLAGCGEEGQPTDGLGLIAGRVRRLAGGDGLPLPHVGWNAVHFTRKHPVTEGIKPDRDYYFVHSYAMQCHDVTDVMAYTDYGETFCSVASRGNVIGFQFHPEKSQTNGLQLIENFCVWDGKC